MRLEDIYRNTKWAVLGMAAANDRLHVRDCYRQLEIKTDDYGYIRNRVVITFEPSDDEFKGVTIESWVERGDDFIQLPKEVEPVFYQRKKYHEYFHVATRDLMQHILNDIVVGLTVQELSKTDY